jgi:hypothetical protein
LKTVTDTPLLDSLGKNALSMAFVDSDQKIAQEVLKLIVNK